MAPPSDPTPGRGVALGSAIFAFVEPHPGHEAAFNRWYERDHLLAAGTCAPWTFASRRWVATRSLKALRYPRESPISRPVERGSFLAALWIQAGRLAEQQAWVAEQMKQLAEEGRTFERRDIVTTAPYDYLGGAFRDADGVPAELALDHAYPGVVCAWLERRPGTALADLRDWLLGDCLPGLLPGSPVAMVLVFTPRPKPAGWPAAAPEVPGVGDRLLLAAFPERSPDECWGDHFAGLGRALEAGGRGDALLVAPFLNAVPGRDTYVDQLR